MKTNSIKKALKRKIEEILILSTATEIKPQFIIAEEAIAYERIRVASLKSALYKIQKAFKNELTTAVQEERRKTIEEVYDKLLKQTHFVGAEVKEVLAQLRKAIREGVE